MVIRIDGKIAIYPVGSLLVCLGVSLPTGGGFYGGEALVKRLEILKLATETMGK